MATINLVIAERNLRRVKDALPRGLALFLGGFSLLNLFGNLRVPGFDANLWWIDLRALPPWLGNSLLIISPLCLIAFAVRPQQSVVPRLFTITCLAVLALVAAVNAIDFYMLWIRGSINPIIPIPFSWFVCAALMTILFARAQPREDQNAKRLLPMFAVCAACMLLFPFAQMLFFGKTDYRRPADVAVVLGARVYADGRPSDALADRVRTACNLYRNGAVKKLLFSGGPGDGSIHETEGMKRMAIQLGVKPEDILVDAHGVNTRATVKNTEAILQQLHASRVLVVSHFIIFRASNSLTTAKAGKFTLSLQKKVICCAKCLSTWPVRLPRCGSITFVRWPKGARSLPDSTGGNRENRGGNLCSLLFHF